jgi:hypothetical protein
MQQREDEVVESLKKSLVFKFNAASELSRKSPFLLRTIDTRFEANYRVQGM